MRIMVDTNALISAIVFKSAKMNHLLQIIFTRYKLVLSSYIINELIGVISEKFPRHIYITENVLARIAYEYIYAPLDADLNIFGIRDSDDYPILYAAITGDVDIFITGDKDFFGLDLPKPEILTPAQFLEKYEED